MVAEFMSSKAIVAKPGKPIEWSDEQIAFHQEGHGNRDRIRWVGMNPRGPKAANTALQGVNRCRFRN
jgi:hypothetical protein